MIMCPAVHYFVRFLLLSVLVVEISSLSEVEASFRSSSIPVVTSIVTVVRPVTVEATTTTVISMNKTCAVLPSSITISKGITFSSAPTAFCRRKKRQYWVHRVVLNEDDHSLKFYPTRVLLSVEPTISPSFIDSRNRRVEMAKKPSPIVIETSFAAKSDGVRVPRPLFADLLSSVVYSIMSSLMTTTIYSTAILYRYLSTLTLTDFTSTVSYSIFGVCYPSGVTLC